MQLKAFVYEDNKEEIGPYGLKYGAQIATTDVCMVLRTALWFNGRGEIIGLGDLHRNDILRLAREMDEDDVFVIVIGQEEIEDMQFSIPKARQIIEERGELEDYCPHCDRHLRTGRHITRIHPEMEKVFAAAKIIVTRGQVIIPTDDGNMSEWFERYWFHCDPNIDKSYIYCTSEEGMRAVQARITA